MTIFNFKPGHVCNLSFIPFLEFPFLCLPLLARFLQKQPPEGHLYFEPLLRLHIPSLQPNFLHQPMEEYNRHF